MKRGSEMHALVGVDDEHVPTKHDYDHPLITIRRGIFKYLFEQGYIRNTENDRKRLPLV